MADSKQGPWWRQKSWWIPGTVLLVLVVVDLVAAFRFASDKDLRSNILSLLIPLVALIAGMAALFNFQEAHLQNERTQERSREEMELQRRGQVTERFTKAIDQLGNDKLDVRLGAIYALEQIARDSEELHWPVMQVLTAYLREHSAGANWKEERERGAAPKARVDFLAVADVIRGRRWEFDAVARVGIEEEKLEQLDRSIEESGAEPINVLSRPPLDEDGHRWPEALNFAGCDLRSANFQGARLKRASFVGADLDLASFEGALLQGASFEQARLRGASFNHARLRGDRIVLSGDEVLSILLAPTRFDGAQLEGANFSVADLQGVYFLGAQLRRATFWHARLANANFERADFTGARLGETDLGQTIGLTQEQLDVAVCDERTKAPPGLTIKVSEVGNRPETQQGASPS